MLEKYKKYTIKSFSVLALTLGFNSCEPPNWKILDNPNF